jgi:hypothetical protein
MAALGPSGRGRGWEKLQDHDMRLLAERMIPYAPRFGSTGYATQDEWLKKVLDGKDGDARIAGTYWVVVAASGKRVVGAHRTLLDALNAYRRMPEADRKPVVEGRGPHNPLLQLADVEPPPGTLFVAAHCRILEPDRRAGFRRAVRVDLTEFGGRRSGNSIPGGELSEPQREYLWLTEAEWRALMPADPRVGQAVPIPPAVEKRILLFYVYNWFTISGGGYWAPKHLHDPELELTVEAVTADAVRMRLTGRVHYKGEAAVGKPLAGEIAGPSPRESGQKLPPTYRVDYDVRIEGVLEFSPKTGRFTRFDAVALGDYRGPWGLSYKEKPVPVGIAFELDQRDLGPERRHAPYTLSALREHYWSPHLWKPRE